MNNTINVLIKNKESIEWFNIASKNLNKNFNFIIHNSFHSFKNELDLHYNAEVAIVDLEIDFISLLTKNYFEMKHKVNFLSISNSKTIDEITILFDNNIKGFIDTSSSSSSLLHAIEDLQLNIFYINDSMKRQLVQQYFNSTIFRSNSNNLKLENKNVIVGIKALNQNENTVCNLLLQGLSYKEIANILGKTTYTVNQRTKKIYKKLNVKSRGELAFKMLNY